MKPKKLGELKGPFIVWLFFTLYFATLMLLGGSSNGKLPQNVTALLVLSLVSSMSISYGVPLIFLLVFLAVWEKRRALRQIFSSIGLRKTGFVKSVFWGFALFPLMILIGLMTMALSYFLGPAPFLRASVYNSGQTPFWYLYYVVIYSFFPVAVVEEAWARGYMLDRLVPQHPSSLVKALPATLLSSFLFTLWHVPGYLWGYSFSIPWLVGLLTVNVFPLSVVLSVACVRARTRNIIGPVLVHFLLDAMPIILTLA